MMLDALEMHRKPESTLNIVLKRSMHEQGDMDAEQAYGDMVKYTFMEYKGALKPSSNMEAMQTASTWEALTFSVGVGPDKNIGKARANKKRRATSRSLHKAATDRYADVSMETDRAEVKEITRALIGFAGYTEMSSDTEDDEAWSDSDYL